MEKGRSLDDVAAPAGGTDGTDGAQEMGTKINTNEETNTTLAASSVVAENGAGAQDLSAGNAAAQDLAENVAVQENTAVQGQANLATGQQGSTAGQDLANQVAAQNQTMPMNQDANPRAGNQTANVVQAGSSAGAPAYPNAGSASSAVNTGVAGNDGAATSNSVAGAANPSGVNPMMDANKMPSMHGRGNDLFASQPIMSSTVSPRGDIILNPGEQQKQPLLPKPAIFAIIGGVVLLVVLAIVAIIISNNGPTVNALEAFTDFRNYLKDGPAEDEALLPLPEEEEEETADDEETEGDDSLVFGETVAGLSDLDLSNGKWFFEVIGDSGASEGFIDKYYENLEEKYGVFEEAFRKGKYEVQEEEGTREELQAYVGKYTEYLDAFGVYLDLGGIEEKVLNLARDAGAEEAEAYIGSLGEGFSSESAKSSIEVVQEFLRQQLTLYSIYTRMGCSMDGGEDPDCVDDAIDYDGSWSYEIENWQESYDDLGVDDMLIEYQTMLTTEVFDGANAIYVALGGSDDADSEEGNYEE